ncbi:class I SAM-dependent methyltransferase [Candidatus Peregrinibacteria bacterium]|nr:class I SAM-dependent methyltransferase [Candidatus Peregrinibacteria bacterium]
MSFLDAIGLTKKITRPRLDAFLARHGSDQKTLEIGCGNDQYGKYFPNRTTLDIEKRQGVQVDIVADAHDLHQIADASFEVILCTEVLEHLHTPHRAIAEFLRILKPGGLLLLSTRFIFPLHDVPGDFYRYTKYGLRHLLRDFEIIELQEEANTIETLAVLYQRIGFQTTTLGLRPLKLLWFMKARIVMLFSWILTREFGDIRHDKEDRSILCSGYYIAARKRFSA